MDLKKQHTLKYTPVRTSAGVLLCPPPFLSPSTGGFLRFLAQDGFRKKRRFFDSRLRRVVEKLRYLAILSKWR